MYIFLVFEKILTATTHFNIIDFEKIFQIQFKFFGEEPIYLVGLPGDEHTH